jgi:hypothetical protein
MIQLKHYLTKPQHEVQVKCISIENLEKVWLIRYNII